MAKIEITPASLIVRVEGADKLWALRSHLEIPLDDVVSAEIASDIKEERESSSTLLHKGHGVPGVLAAGTFWQHGQKVFWDVHHPKRAIVIHLEKEDMAKLVVGVDDPTTTVAQIERAIAGRHAVASAR